MNKELGEFSLKVPKNLERLSSPVLLTKMATVDTDDPQGRVSLEIKKGSLTDVVLK